MWQKAELDRTFTLPEQGTPRFACASFTLVSKTNVTVGSTLCLTASKGKFVKFRVTGVGTDPGEPLRFIEAWAPLLTPGV